jgi:hypothetical protein
MTREDIVILGLFLVIFLAGFIIGMSITEAPHQEHLCIERTCPDNKYSDFSKVCNPSSCTIPDNATITSATFNVGRQSEGDG